MEENSNKYTYNLLHSRGCCKISKNTAQCQVNELHRLSKLDSNNWLSNIEPPKYKNEFEFVEIRFKNGRKEFFKTNEISEYSEGDIVAVEGNPGHDIGIITLKGEIVRFQMKKKNIDIQSENIKKLYRKAKITDIEKWLTAIENEEKTMKKAKNIAATENLEMKINDVEYQGDSTKAIFYYTAEERIDFRNLIKLLAEEFKVRIEMRQIGARQEASRLGGIGTCGRELCCSSWLTNFKSVSTNSARLQQLSLNPQKLAGQCGKLKCCLNFEYDCYIDALKDFPSTDEILRTEKGNAIYSKTEVFKGTMWYFYENDTNNIFELEKNKVKEIIEQNKKGKKISKLEDFAVKEEKKRDYDTYNNEEDLKRFDSF